MRQFIGLSYDEGIYKLEIYCYALKDGEVDQLILMLAEKKKLEEKGINENDLKKILELTLEYNVNLYKVIIDTFGQDKKTKTAIKEILSEIDAIFNDYDKFKEEELKVF